MTIFDQKMKATIISFSKKLISKEKATFLRFDISFEQL